MYDGAYRLKNIRYVHTHLQLSGLPRQTGQSDMTILRDQARDGCNHCHVLYDQISWRPLSYISVSVGQLANDAVSVIPITVEWWCRQGSQFEFTNSGLLVLVPAIVIQSYLVVTSTFTYSTTETSKHVQALPIIYIYYVLSNSKNHRLMVMGAQPMLMTPFCTHIRVCLRRRASGREQLDGLTKVLPVQQTGCWVQELPEPVPSTVVGEHEIPTTWLPPILIVGGGSPNNPKSPVTKVEADCWKMAPQSLQVTDIDEKSSPSRWNRSNGLHPCCIG